MSEMAQTADLLLVIGRGRILAAGPVQQVIDSVSEERDPPQVIVLTTFDADEHVVRALALGAKGFLLKDTSPPMIVEAIEKVAAGQPILPRA